MTILIPRGNNKGPHGPVNYIYKLYSLSLPSTRREKKMTTGATCLISSLSTKAEM